MAPNMVVAEYDNAPWVLVHDDLHSNNLLVDDDLDIVG
jgi:aminoglycoside phosphotransferase (APT) family kinase protein